MKSNTAGLSFSCGSRSTVGGLAGAAKSSGCAMTASDADFNTVVSEADVDVLRLVVLVSLINADMDLEDVDRSPESSDSGEFFKS